MYQADKGWPCRRLMSTWLDYGKPRNLVKHYVWVCLSLFLKDTNMLISRLSKAGGSPSVGRQHLIQWVSSAEQNGEGVLNSPLPNCTNWDGDPLYYTPGSQIFGLGLESIASVVWLWVSSSQTWNFSASIAVSQVLIINLILDIYMFYSICFSGQPDIVFISCTLHDLNCQSLAM